jgi:phosphatidylserine decarboxylase
MSIGHHPGQSQHTPDMRKKDEDITESEKAEAKRRIEGSITPRNEGEVGGGLPTAATMAG